MRLFNSFLVVFFLSTNAYAYGTSGCDLSTVFLAHMDGADASTSFAQDTLCKGTGIKAITANGNAQVDTAEKKWGGSLLLDGSGDYLSTPDSADWDFGTGNFTVDGWFWWDATGGNYFLWSRGGDPSNEFNLFHSANAFYFYLENAAVINGFAFTPTVNTWYHIEVSRFGSTVRLFINGVFQTSATSAADCQDSNGIVIGYRSGVTEFPGQIDEFRISNVARHPNANTFTPSTSPYCSGCEMMMAA